jgi:hypothetical protein
MEQLLSFFQGMVIEIKDFYVFENYIFRQKIQK